MARSNLRSNITRIARTLDEHLDPYIRRAAEDIEAGAKSRCPRSDLDKHHLADAIHVVKNGDAAYQVVAGDAEAWYGHIVEGGSTTEPPRPFLTPAIEAVNIDERLREAARSLE